MTYTYARRAAWLAIAFLYLVTGAPGSLSFVPPLGLHDLAFGASGTGIVTTPMEWPPQPPALTPRADAHARCIADRNGRIVVGGYVQDPLTACTGAVSHDFVVACYDTTGHLDPSFKDSTYGTSGYVTEDFGALSFNNNGCWWHECNGVAILNDTTIVAVGSENSQQTQTTPDNFVLVHYMPDGHHDPFFGTNGVVVTTFKQFGIGGSSRAQGVALQPDGKIVVAGWFRPAGSIVARFALARYNPMNGQLDQTFGSHGCTVTDFGPGSDAEGNAIAIVGGSIVVAGTLTIGGKSRMAVARYRTIDGQLDPTFNNTGTALAQFGPISTEARAVAIDPTGSIVAAGSGQLYTDRFVALARFRHSGDLDTNFGFGGLAIGYGPLAWANGLIIQPHGPAGPHGGWLTVAGEAAISDPKIHHHFLLQRFSPINGNIEPTLGTSGVLIDKAVSPPPQGMSAAYALTMDGSFKIIAVGESSIFSPPAAWYDFALARYR